MKKHENSNWNLLVLSSHDDLMALQLSIYLFLLNSKNFLHQHNKKYNLVEIVQQLSKDTLFEYNLNSVNIQLSPHIHMS